MLSVPTLFMVFFINFMALGLVWFYVMRSYPTFVPARAWTGCAFVAAAAATLSLLRGVVHPLVPVLLGGGLMIFACWLALMGVQRFLDQPTNWRQAVVGTLITVAGLALFTIWRDDMPVRVLVYSTGQSVPALLAMRLLIANEQARHSPGSRMAAGVAGLLVAVHAIRSAAALFGGEESVTLVDFNAFQAVMLVILVFLSMAWNFGFLLMAIDRLRAEVADLAMLDDLTGAANRRQLFMRLAEACAQAQRSGEPLSLLAIDLDGFKPINDNYGHAAGDECLRLFTTIVPVRLRQGDLLARSGGDEFCVVLPSTTSREGAMIARQILEACSERFVSWQGAAIPITVSIGVAQWRPEVGTDVARLIAAADQALYAAKNDGKNRYVVYQPPSPASLEPIDLRRSA